MKRVMDMLKAVLQNQVSEDTFRLYKGATAVSLTQVDGTYTGTAPDAKGAYDLDEDEMA
ncbi:MULTISPECIES: hypothetical protein [Laceyella]|nr:hypothetical protein [Laceyella sediminis]MRG29279.1 hypothetical protein [Laceyella tengchongensis]